MERQLTYRLTYAVGKDNDKTLKAFEQRQEKSIARVEKRGIRAIKREAKEQEKAAKEEEKLKSRVFRNRMKLLSQIGKAEEKQRRDTKRAEEKATKEEEKRKARVFRNRIKLLDRIGKHEEKKRREREREEQRTSQRIARDHKRTISALERQVDQGMGRIETGRAQMTDGILASTESVARLGRGFAVMGLLGEESTKKMLVTLVKVQASFDLAVGAVNTYRNLTRAVEGYRLALQGAAATEAGIAALRASSAAAGSAGDGGGGIGTAVAGQVGGQTILGGAKRIAGGAAGKSGLAILSKLGQVAAVLFVIASLMEKRKGTLGASGSVTGTVSEKAFGLTEFIRRKRSDEQLQERVDKGNAGQKAEAQIEISRRRVEATRRSGELAAIKRDRKQRRDESRISLQGSLLDAKSTSLSLRSGVSQSPQGRLRTLRQGFQIASQRRQVGIQAISGGSKELGLDQTAKAAVDLIQNAKGQLAAYREIAAVRRNTSNEAIASGKQELELVKGRIKVEKDRFLTAKERFGQRSEEDQKRIIRTKAKAERFGFASLDRSERQDLRSVGTGRATDLARAGDIRSANQAGFDRFFGSSERQKIGELTGQKRNLELTVQQKVAINAQLKLNEDRLAARIQAFIDERAREFEAAVTEKVRILSERQDAADAKATDTRLSQANSVRGR